MSVMMVQSSQNAPMAMIESGIDGGRSDHHVNDAFSRIGASPSRRRQPHRLMQRPRVRSIHGLVCCSGVGRATHCWAEVAVFGRSAAAGTT
jgi:hypothetical protein